MIFKDLVTDRPGVDDDQIKTLPCIDMCMCALFSRHRGRCQTAQHEAVHGASVLTLKSIDEHDMAEQYSQAVYLACGSQTYVVHMLYMHMTLQQHYKFNHPYATIFKVDSSSNRPSYSSSRCTWNFTRAFPRQLRMFNISSSPLMVMECLSFYFGNNKNRRERDLENTVDFKR